MTEPQLPITLNHTSISQLMAQTELALSQEPLPDNKKAALQNLKSALTAVLPFMPPATATNTNEVELENEIREEIVIAGANENG